MHSSFFKPVHEKQFMIIALIVFSFMLMPKAVMAVAAQNISCSNSQGGVKQINVEPLNTGGKACRTLYVASPGQSKEIAWAQSSVQFCAEVAYRLMNKLTHAGWHCASDTTFPQAAVDLSQLKSYKTHKHKRKAPHHYVDHALLESIKK